MYHQAGFVCWNAVLLTFCPGWSQTMILPISTYQVAEITGMYHHAWHHFPWLIVLFVADRIFNFDEFQFIFYFSFVFLILLPLAWKTHTHTHTHTQTHTHRHTQRTFFVKDCKSHLCVLFLQCWGWNAGSCAC
jgi:hypothetical protein